MAPMTPIGAGRVVFGRATPLESITSHFSSEQSILFTHLAVWLFAFLSAVSVALRFFAIWYRKFVTMADDWLLAASWVMVLFYSIAASLALALGTGSSSADTLPSTTPSAPLLFDSVTRSIALTAAAWAKSAVACGLLGLCDQRLMKWALLALVALVNIVAVGGIATQWMRCQPIYKAWTVGVDGSCLDRATSNAIEMSVQAFYALTDIILVGLGYMLLWSRAKGLMPVEKIGAGFLGILGLLASTAAVLTAIELSTLSDANFAASNIRPLLLSSLEAPIIIIAASLPTLRLLRSENTVPLRPRARRSLDLQRRPSSSSLTPLDPSSSSSGPHVPSRPVRPVSTRSFMTISAKADKVNNSNNNKESQQRGLAGNSIENPVKGSDVKYSYWNPSIPPTNINPIASQTTRGGVTPRQQQRQRQQQQRQQQQQQHQHQGQQPALSMSSTLYAAPYTPETPSSTRGIGTNLSYSQNIDSRSNNNVNDSTSYNWHATNPYPTYQFPTANNIDNHRLRPLEEEKFGTTNNAGMTRWNSERDPGVGLGRNTGTLTRNASIRRESPTFGNYTAWNKGGSINDNNNNNNNSNIGAQAAPATARGRSSLERGREPDHDTTRGGGKSYFARLQALTGFTGYSVGNPFTNRV